MFWALQLLAEPGEHVVVTVPNYFRIGVGRRDPGPALEAFDAYLERLARVQPRSQLPES
jgi:hypothetical protein